MPAWLRAAAPVASAAELVGGSDRLDGAIWSSPAPTARPHRRVDRHAATGNAHDWGARLSESRWRVASAINIQPHATYVNLSPISAETAAAAQIRSYLLRSGSRHAALRRAAVSLRSGSIL